MKLNFLLSERTGEQEINIEKEESSSKVIVRYSNINSLTINERANFTCHFKGIEKVQLHWLINGQRVDPRTNIIYPFPNYLGLSFVVDGRYVDGQGRISVKCVATKVFWRFQNNNGIKPTFSVLLFLINVSTLIIVVSTFK